MAKEGSNVPGFVRRDGLRNCIPCNNLSEEQLKRSMEAMQSKTIHIVKRMKEITLVMKTPEDVLEAQDITSADIEDMLDELKDHVVSIGMVHDVQSIGCLIPLLDYLRNTHAGIRAKAAEVVTTILQIIPTSQQLVMEANGLEPLLNNFSSDPDVTARTKALGAISLLICTNKPGITAFRLANGYAALRDALSSESVRFQRKALNLIPYLLHENSSDCNIMTELGFPRIMMHLTSSDDAEVREAAHRGLRVLEKDTEGGNNGQVNSFLQEGIERIRAAREDNELAKSMWYACYHEPSSPREPIRYTPARSRKQVKVLLVLPGEDAPALDVASKLFEPPLRAAAAAEAADRNSNPVSEKKEAPLLVGLDPPPSATPTVESNSSSSNNEQSNPQT